MTNLVLSYITLFSAALLVGFAAGWLLRSIVMQGVRQDVEADIDLLGQALRKAQARAALDR